MIKVEVIREFTLGRYDELKNIARKSFDEKNRLFVGDTFECSKEMADYLMGANTNGDVVVKVIEVIPELKDEPQEEVVEEAKPKKSTKKKSSKK